MHQLITDRLPFFTSPQLRRGRARAHFAGGGGEAVAHGAGLRGEQLAGEQPRGCVGAPLPEKAAGRPPSDQRPHCETGDTGHRQNSSSLLAR